MNDTIFEQIMAIRRDRQSPNMLDIPAVQRMAYEKDFFELVCFIEEHKSEYVNFIFYGRREAKSE